MGIRIQGGSSPASPQKGLHVIARGAYGKNRIEFAEGDAKPWNAMMQAGGHVHLMAGGGGSWMKWQQS